VSRKPSKFNEALKNIETDDIQQVQDPKTNAWVYESMSMGEGTIDPDTGLLTCEATIYHSDKSEDYPHGRGKKDVESLDIKIKVTSAVDEEMQRLEIGNGGTLEGTLESLYEKARGQIPEVAAILAR
jgi:hypothetical protein